MSNENKHIKTNSCIPRSTLISYIKGELDNLEMNAIEQHLMACPMCSDELEGLMLLNNPSDIDEISERLNLAIDEKVNKSKIKITLTPFRVAAAIALLIGFASIIYFTSTLETQREDLAISMSEQQEKEQTAEVDSMDEVVTQAENTATSEFEAIEKPARVNKEESPKYSNKEKTTALDSKRKNTASGASAKKQGSSAPSPPASSQTLNSVLIDEDVVDDDIELFEISSNEEIVIEDMAFIAKEEEVEEEQVFIVVEQMPTFMAEGYKDFREYIAKNIRYPEEAAQNGIQGKVYVQFIVEPDGTLSNIKVIRGLAPSIDEEAIRVVKSSPKWQPGTQRGKPVKTQFTVPIVFALE